jgi:uncharacterized protein with gpF-like domain
MNRIQSYNVQEMIDFFKVQIDKNPDSENLRLMFENYSTNIHEVEKEIEVNHDNNEKEIELNRDNNEKEIKINSKNNEKEIETNKSNNEKEIEVNRDNNEKEYGLFVSGKQAELEIAKVKAFESIQITDRSHLYAVITPKERKPIDSLSVENLN